ncbi:MAG: hypothetical protein C0434_07920 [Xanthomonadaceae bacterium]|nr:hypothetical protein [Xanthomonadaceae bacterium]
MSEYEVKTHDVFELVDWQACSAWTDDGRDVIAVSPIFHGPGQPHPVPAPPFALTEESASRLVADLSRELAALRATKASRGQH